VGRGRGILRSWRGGERQGSTDSTLDSRNSKTHNQRPKTRHERLKTRYSLARHVEFEKEAAENALFEIKTCSLVHADFKFWARGMCVWAPFFTQTYKFWAISV